MKLIKLTCNNCGKEFTKSLAKYNRYLKLYQENFFCSVSCSVIHRNRLRKDKNIDNERNCTICGRTYIYSKSKGHRLTRCNTCENRIHREKRKRKLIDCKGSKCEICGYDKCLGALEFHHLDPSKKEFQLNVNYASQAWEIVKKEIDKCILVCANCHREIHTGLINLKHRRTSFNSKM